MFLKSRVSERHQRTFAEQRGFVLVERHQKSVLKGRVVENGRYSDFVIARGDLRTFG